MSKYTFYMMTTHWHIKTPSEKNANVYELLDWNTGVKPSTAKGMFVVATLFDYGLQKDMSPWSSSVKKCA